MFHYSLHTSSQRVEVEVMEVLSSTLRCSSLFNTTTLVLLECTYNIGVIALQRPA